MNIIVWFLSVLWILDFQASARDEYILDTSSGFGRRFDGIGAISGGGATSKLLQNYPEQQRNEILDFLFKPNFGASLQIFKVEIGGDVQSTEGTECSHMHESWDEDYTRGYEWWLMLEAKKRNPDIKLYGLPWGFPGWLGPSDLWPYSNPAHLARYVVNWVQGAKTHYNLTIDFLGIWNEKPYSIEYVKVLRKTLNRRGFGHVKLVIGDLEVPSAWEVIDDMLKDSDFNDTLDYVGCHYPQMVTPWRAQTCGKPLWSSEDSSSVADDSGAASLAQLISQNYVTGYMTSTIVWNAVAAYYNDLPIARHSLMVASEPWSGSYEVAGPVWVMAHTTHFTQIGWLYLQHNAGVSLLRHGGSLVTLISPSGKDVSIILETMRTPLGGAKRSQNITLILKARLSSVKTLNIYCSRISHRPRSSTYFINKGKVTVINGRVNLDLELGEIYTLSTLTTASKGHHNPPPPSKPFPLPYKETFNSYTPGSEAFNFAQQVGAFEVHRDDSNSDNKVLVQVVQTAPIHWCPQSQTQPVTLIGNFNWTDISVSVQVLFPLANSTKGIFVGLHVNQGGCYTFTAQGIYVFLLIYNQSLTISRDLSRTEVVYSVPYKVNSAQWYNVTITTRKSHVTLIVDHKTMFDATVKMNSNHGFVGLGTDNFGRAYFDDFSVTQA